MMAYRNVDHVALRMHDLRAAEEYYCMLFGAHVVFREAEAGDGWRTLPPWAGWEEAEAMGITLGLSVIARDGLTLALFATPNQVPADGILDHVAVHVEEADLTAVRQLSNRLGGRLVHDRPGVLIVDDRFGVRWELTTLPEDYGSAGEVRDRWLDVGSRSDSSAVR